MDISNSYQSNNMPTRAFKGGTLNYDLKSEKQEMEEITKKVKAELLANWKKSYANAQTFPAQIAAMHPDVVDFLLSFNLGQVYDDIAKQTNLDAKGRNALPQIVWQIAQTKNWDGLDKIIEEKIQLAVSMRAIVAQLLRQHILNKAHMLSEKPVAQKVMNAAPQKKQIQLSVSAALTEYPKLNEQNITDNQLKLQNYPDLVRPSIRNWIKDYHDAMGAMKHSPIDRGNFLFHSENGKVLSAPERQKLAIILKSLDENTLLTIDPEAQVIIFDKVDETRTENGLNTVENQSKILANSHFPENPSQHMNPDLRFLGNDKEGDSANHVDQSDNLEFAKRQDDLEKFYAPNPGLKAAVQEMPANKPTAILKNISFSPNFLSKKKTENSSIEKSSPADRGLSVEEKNDYFSVPESKPPIGSAAYNVIKTDSAGVANDAPAEAYQGLIIGEISKQQNQDSLSDEMLFKNYQERNNKKNSVGLNIVPGDASVSFSSPQQLSAEQKLQNFKEVLNPLPILPAADKTKVSSPAYISSRLANPYHIGPANSSYEKMEKNTKNIVDLKN